MPRKHKTTLVVEIRDEDMPYIDFLRGELPKLAALVLREVRRRRAIHERLVNSLMSNAKPRRIDMQKTLALARRVHRRKAAERQQARRRGRHARRRHLAQATR